MAQKYLDDSGLEYLWSKIKSYIAEHASGGGSAKTTWYGTSSTAAATAAKVVTCADYALEKGSTGAKTIYSGNGTLNATTNTLKWSANTIITFMYDGTYFRYISARAAASVVPPDGAGTWYGTCRTTATTQAKVGTIANFRLMPGAFVVLRCTTANTYASAKITLNINSTGAKDVYVNNAVTSANNNLLWDIGDILTFVYDGTYYRFVSSDADRKKADNAYTMASTASETVSELFKVVQYSYNYTCAANTGINISDDNLGLSTPDGYEPFTMANVLTGNAGVVIRSMQPRLVSGTTAALSLRNVTSASVSATVTVQMIYIKTGVLTS